MFTLELLKIFQPNLAQTWVEGIQVCSIEEPYTFPKNDYNEIALH